MTDLLLEIESVTDMDLERAALVGRADDAEPELRPERVGGVTEYGRWGTG